MMFFLIIFSLICACYATMVLLFFIGLCKFKENKNQHNQSLKNSLSVIVPFRNEEKNIAGLIKSIASQKKTDFDYELILVNDHSSDNGFAIAKNLLPQHKNMRLFSLPIGQSGKKMAIAFGVSHAKHSVVVLTDADCIHPPKWLSEISSLFNRNVSMIIGPVMLNPQKSIFQKLQALEHASLTASTIGACSIGLPFMASSANLAFNRQVISFNPKMLNPLKSSGDDVFLLHSIKRIEAKGVSCMHAPDALVSTEPVNTIKEFFSQRSRWASKASGYKDIVAILVSLIVFLFNLMMVVLAAISSLSIKYISLLLIGISIKMIVDYLLLHKFLKRYGKVNLMWVFIPLQMIYPFYIVTAVGLSIFALGKWKGRG